MHQLHYIDEIKPVGEIEEMSEAAAITDSQQQPPIIDNKELSLGKTLVENLTSKQFDTIQYSDEYTKQLEQLIINAKTTSRHKTPTTTTATFENQEDSNKNLLEALKASIQHKRRQKH
jgi:non-homologous end joining protein Ku